MREKEKTQITEVMTEKEDITNHLGGGKKIIKEYCEWSYANKLNLVEMDKFLEIYKLQILTQDDIENLKRPITNRLSWQF